MSHPDRPSRPDDPVPPDPDPTSPVLDRAFATGRRMARRGTPEIDVDQVIAVAAAAVERHRARRLALLRVTGIGLVLALLVGWTLLFSRGGTDVLYAAALFAVPALAVFRWYLESLDGGGLAPWRVPPTVDAWSRRTAGRVDDLAAAIGRLDDLRARLAVIAVRAGRGSSGGSGGSGSSGAPGSSGVSGFDGLHGRIDAARDDLDRVRTRLDDVRVGAPRFVESCRRAPDGADWRLLREVDPAGIRAVTRHAVAELEFVARNAPTLSPRDEPLTVELWRVCHETTVLRRHLGRTCAEVVEALDTLHDLATRATLQATAKHGVVRRATSALAVARSGWGVSPVERSAIRNVLLTLPPDGVFRWGPAVRRARAAGRRETVPAGSRR